MQIVKVMGGMGNQMFAYAFALRLRRLGRQVSLDTSWHDRHKAHNGWELSRLFDLDIPECDAQARDRLADLSEDLASRLRRKVFGTKRGHVVEQGPGYDPRFLTVTGDAYLDGYWQSPLYHEGVQDEIEETFAFPGDLEASSLEALDAARGRTLIGVHVRRGDYLDSTALGGVCGEGYYRHAIEALSQDARDPVVFFLSDDLDWCRERLGREHDSVYVDWNRGIESWRDMRLMTKLDRLAISNSSFGWWAARLSRRKAGGLGVKVIAPDRWYGGRHPDNRDIALLGWIRLASGGDS